MNREYKLLFYLPTPKVSADTHGKSLEMEMQSQNQQRKATNRKEKVSRKMNTSETIPDL